MTDFQLNLPKDSVFSDSTLQSRSKSSYHVPHNSPREQNKQIVKEKYRKSNGERKGAKHKIYLQQQSLKTPISESSQNRSIVCEENHRLDKPPALTQFTMFYEQQQLVKRKAERIQEKNSATVIFQSDAKVVSSSTNTLSKRDIETNTDPENNFKLPNQIKNAPNSSIISMKTNKPEEDDDIVITSRKGLNVQKMPSVNIRPEFTIQRGPKINIVASSANVYKQKRKNTEFFDVVYPDSSPVFNEFSGQPETERQTKTREYICERHVFPSGRLICGIHNDDLKETHGDENITLDDKKAILKNLIKSVSEKVEKQMSKDKESCCRLNCSLPLLASVVNKVEVDCVRCLDVLIKHMDRLIQLMREELRSQKEMSEVHCCQLDETVQYQIVEFELMQDENTKHHQRCETLRSFKHKGFHK